MASGFALNQGLSNCYTIQPPGELWKPTITKPNRISIKSGSLTVGPRYQSILLKHPRCFHAQQCWVTRVFTNPSEENLNVQMNHWRILLTCRFWFIRLGAGAGRQDSGIWHLPKTLPKNYSRTTLWIERSKPKQCLLLSIHVNCPTQLLISVMQNELKEQTLPLLLALLLHKKILPWKINKNLRHTMNFKVKCKLIRLDYSCDCVPLPLPVVPAFEGTWNSNAL